MACAGALVGGPADPVAFRRAAAQRGQGLSSPRGRSCAAASTACREAVVTAVGTPVARMDGPAKVTGARRRSPAGGWSRSTPRPAAPTACWRVLTHEDLPKIAAHRGCCHCLPAVRRGRELCPDAGPRRALRGTAGGHRRRRVRMCPVRCLARAPGIRTPLRDQDRMAASLTKLKQLLEAGHGSATQAAAARTLSAGQSRRPMKT